MNILSKQLAKLNDSLSEDKAHLSKLGLTNLLPDFLWIFLPSVLLISFITYGLIFQYQTHQQQLRKIAIENSIEHLVSHVELTYQNITTDLFYLAESDIVRRFSDGIENSKILLANELLQFSLKKSLYDQVRFIDTNGMEKLRISYNKGQVSIVSDNALQNKVGRYYFQASMELSKDEIFVSPLDLNIEHGQVERPFKPMIRFGTPVFDSNGNKKGILLFNFLAEKLLDSFRQMEMKTKGHHSMLNRNGYWLYSSDPNNEWGFMFPERQELTFGHRFPEVWHEVRENRAGVVSLGKLEFIYNTVYLSTQELYHNKSDKTQKLTIKTLEGQNDFWKVITYHPVITFSAVIFSSGFWLLYCLSILAIAMGIWFRSRSRFQEQLTLKHLKQSRADLKKIVNERSNELFKSYQQLELILESTGEAIYGINNQGLCTFVNQACLKILNYQDESQLLEKNMHVLIHHRHADGSPYDEDLCPILNAFHKGRGYDLNDEVIWRSDGSSFSAEIHSYPIEQNEKIIGAVVTFNDITESKYLEAILNDTLAYQSAILSAIPDLMFELDENGKYLNVWSQNPDELAASRSQLIGKTVAEILPDDASEQVMTALREADELNQTHGQQIQIMTLGGEMWFELSVSIKDRDSSPHQFIMLSRNITVQKHIENEKRQLIHDMEERMKELQCIYGVTEAIRTYDTLDNIFYHVVKIIPSAWLYPEYIKVRIIFNEKEYVEKPFELTQWKLSSELMPNNQCKGFVEVYYTGECSGFDEGKFLNQEYNLINGIAKTLSETIELKQVEIELQHLASHDPLTGLYNRKFLEERISDEISRADRYQHSLSLFMLDIDHFKQVNDTYGHIAGDSVLCSFSGILQQFIRKSDYAARYGGEEFVIVLPEVSLHDAGEMAQRLCDNIAKYNFLINDKQVLKVTASIGVATYPEPVKSWKELIEASDSALYQAKEAGRNQIKISE